ncbi:MAG: Orotidine 5'-phosphate decarboxylase [Berkelbacteria bacterium GW2011_GWA2_38_9]|uniref:Orotidine 5'-phosphate decarboxylase n=1 Tax=Berkelbacteria bacterium GW2011_GWA2_38_9 TaxID=1618334 RepID=A0A0G0PC97_9BACT|nr:MAG: Orotidine 5'-phosphate decarboxylase [Berkelbacteria bacterium GW2011_GWA2_38_9]
MGERNFRELLEAQWSRGNFVCVGLDSDPEKIPESVQCRYDTASTISLFNRAIIEATSDLVCAYKPNLASYLKYGQEGLEALYRTSILMRYRAPDIPVILDAKYADIGNTNLGYASFAFDRLEVDAVTVHPYLGAEALKPFLDQTDKGIFVLCRTSNPGAGEFQDLKVDMGPILVNDQPRYRPLYQVVAQQVTRDWNKNDNCALVVGATYPDELREVRKLVGDMPILIPGIGAQGGDIEKTIVAGKDSRGQGMIINSSRGIIFASSGDDFAEVARRETIRLCEEIDRYRGGGKKG